MKILTDIYKALDNFFSRDEVKIINERDKNIDILNENIINLTRRKTQLKEQLEKALKENNNFKTDMKDLKNTNKHETLASYMEWLKANVKPGFTRQKTQHGKVRPHRDLQRTKDYVKVLNFAETVLTSTEFKDEDDLVYKFNMQFQQKYPTNKWYKIDYKVWGTLEYWETAEEVIDLIHKKKTFSDCDSVSILKYWSMRLLLDKHFPSWDKRRLAIFVVTVNIIGGGHAMLGWVKKGPNDWVPIESTYFNENFRHVWNGNYRVRTNTIAYKVHYSFDTVAEYLRI